jgi:hypothetical protein
MSDRGEVILCIGECDGSSIAIKPEHEQEIRAAWRKWIESGKTRDVILEVTSRSGGDYSFLASSIVSINKTDAEVRAEWQRMEKRDNDERARNRTDAGLFEDS